MGTCKHPCFKLGSLDPQINDNLYHLDLQAVFLEDAWGLAGHG